MGLIPQEREKNKGEKDKSKCIKIEKISNTSCGSFKYEVFYGFGLNADFNSVNLHYQ